MGVVEVRSVRPPVGLGARNDAARGAGSCSGSGTSLQAASTAASRRYEEEGKRLGLFPERNGR